jgi:Transposase zinc-ribbon domain
MAAPDLVNLSGLMDDAKCFAFVRQHRWPEGVRCPVCDGAAVIRDGCDDTQPCRQRYRSAPTSSSSGDNTCLRQLCRLSCNPPASRFPRDRGQPHEAGRIKRIRRL